MTKSQADGLEAAIAELRKLGGSVTIDGGPPGQEGYAAALSSLDTNWAQVVIEDLRALIVVTEANSIQGQFHPKGIGHRSTPIVNIRVDGDGTPTVASRWT